MIDSVKSSRKIQQYFIADNMNTKYFMFCLVNFMSFVNIHPFLSFRPATHSKKSWDRSNLGLVMR